MPTSDILQGFLPVHLVVIQEIVGRLLECDPAHLRADWHPLFDVSLARAQDRPEPLVFNYRMVTVINVD